jgi:LmbE family N-acetylglucosaminyl deacetylase
MAQSVLIVAAHPDDEVIGIGGTAARHAAAGDAVHIVILGEGLASRNGSKTEKGALREAGRRAAAAIGAEPPIFAGLPDNRLDSLDLLDIVRHIEEAVEAVKPATVYTHHGNDLNVDHSLVHRATLTACRPLPQSSVRSIYTFETASSTEWGSPDLGAAFVPARFVDISATLATKRKALEAYAAEMRPFPHPRSIEAIEALARWRGASVGLDAAEAFGVVREVER